MPRLCRALLVAAVALGVASPPAAAVPDEKLRALTGELWQTVIETPTPENLFGPNGGDPCVDLGGVVAPFAPVFRSPELTCTVKPGTKIFVAAWTSECSTLEAAPFFGDDPAELEQCARDVDADIAPPVVTLEGRPVRLREVVSGLLRLDLPADNIFGAPEGTGPLSVAHGWVALLHPLPPGTHTISLHAEGTYVGDPVDFDNVTTIVVRPRA